MTAVRNSSVPVSCATTRPPFAILATGVSAMTEAVELVQARDARHDRDWARAYALFTAAQEDGPLSAEDLDALSDVAWWLGRIDDSVAAGEAAFRGHLDADRPRKAAMTALTTAVSLFLRGDDAHASGWMSRVQRLLQDLPEGPEHGYLRYVVEVEGGLDGDDLDAVAAAARDVSDIGRRHDDRTLVAVGVLGEGRALVRLGVADRGLALLDEAMVAVLHDDLDPSWAGNVYCHLMSACHELSDIGRAREWTEATSEWLSHLSAAVLFTGICRVHRSQVLQVTGDWDAAEREATRVCADLADIGVATVAEAHHQLGELRRLRGDLDGAEEAYGRARELGRDPQPGHARLQLARGHHGAAATAIRAALAAAGPDRLARARLCTAQVEIALVVGDLDTARRACAELEDTAATYRTSGLEASALHWRGAVELAEGRPDHALAALRAACRRWHDVQAPYDTARACLLLARAYRDLGDHDTATAEEATARDILTGLGAAEAGVRHGATPPLPAGMTAREVEVLALVARGQTNRAVAEALVLSEKTIARHLSNIFVKLDVSTRTEAAAFAFEHGLVDTRHG